MLSIFPFRFGPLPPANEFRMFQDPQNPSKGHILHHCLGYFSRVPRLRNILTMDLLEAEEAEEFIICELRNLL